MIDITIATHAIPTRLMAIAADVEADVDLAVWRAGARIRTKVRAAASGRPGPRAQTGNYRRSIAQTNTRQDGEAVAYIHTNMPQGPRLEYGFVGIDAIGRRYNQPPYPHFRPAAEGALGDLTAEVHRAVWMATQRRGF